MKEQSITKGFAVLSAAGMVVKVLSLFYAPFLTRILSQENMGFYQFTYQIFLFLYVLTNSGIPVAISKMVSELIAQHNYKDAVKTFKIARTTLLILGFAASILMIILAGPITVAAKQEKARLAIIVLSPTILITSIMSAYRGYFQGRGNMTPTAISQIAEQVINTVFSLIFAALLIRKTVEGGVAGATVGTSLGALVACIYLIYVYGKNKKFKVPKGTQSPEVKRLSNRAIFRKMINYGVPITISVGLQSAGTLIDNSLIKPRLIVAGFMEKEANKRFATLGQMSSLINVPITIISALSAAVLPAISAAAALDDKRKVQDKINQALKLCFMISIPSAVGLAVLSRPIFALLFPDAVNGEYLMKFSCLVVVLMSVVQIQTTILQSIGKLYIVTTSMALGILMKIITSYSLVAITEINTLGAVLGNIVCFTVPLLVNSWYIRRLTKYKLDLIRYSAKPLVTSAFMGIIVYMIYFTLETFMINGDSSAQYVMPIAISMLIGAFAYAYGLILSGGIKRSDLDAMSPRFIKIIPNFMKERMR
ncbi:putative polysaccharide biosynthesis protein [Clostridium thermarum]|uniref:putative polysaccharide biosynthesis protein n=1 Tax=Clostridium thermarum TaxID=1716543 RepID=UPI001124AA74|nr:polysaccharide biosynthesis protein [Clostridium thermarum]